MSRLIRMDQTGHTTLAEWTATDPAAVQAAVEAFRAELDQGYFAVGSLGEGEAEQVTELPLDEPLVILLLRDDDRALAPLERQDRAPAARASRR
jgi:hypothetical protein